MIRFLKIAGFVVAVVVLVLALTACGGDPPPDEGYVREKRFTPAHWEDGYRTEHYTDCGMHLNYEGDLTYSCRPASRSIYEAHHHWVTDRFALYLENCQPEDTKNENKCKRGWRGVAPDEYNDYAVGSHYPDAR